MNTAFFITLIRDQRGASAIEMGLICSLIALAAFSSMQGFANQSKTMWTTVSQKFQASNKAAAS